MPIHRGVHSSRDAGHQRGKISGPGWFSGDSVGAIGRPLDGREIGRSRRILQP